MSNLPPSSGTRRGSARTLRLAPAEGRRAITGRKGQSIRSKYSLRDSGGTTRGELDRHYDAVENFLGIAPTPEDVLGRRNTLFRDGCDALGYASEPISRNVKGCRGSGVEAR